MTGPIDFYFDFSSPYGYLAARRIDQIGQRFGREVAWRPFLLGVVFKTTGAVPLLNIPIKGDYARRDLARSARRLEVPFVLPAPFPFMSVAACRATYWLTDRDAQAGKALAKALYHAAFGQGRAIGDPKVVAEVAAGLGHDGADVLAAVQTPEVKDRLKREVDAAVARGVFGSPYTVVDGEPFWGYDRLEDVSLWLESGGW